MGGIKVCPNPHLSTSPGLPPFATSSGFERTHHVNQISTDIKVLSCAIPYNDTKILARSPRSSIPTPAFRSESSLHYDQRLLRRQNSWRPSYRYTDRLRLVFSRAFRLRNLRHSTCFTPRDRPTRDPRRLHVSNNLLNIPATLGIQLITRI